MAGPLVIVDAPSFPFEYLSDNPLEMVLAWSVDNDALTNAFAVEGITSFGYLNNQLDFKVQLDSSPDFNTINLKEYKAETANSYHYGINVYAMDVPVPKRNYKKDLTLYWRVKHDLSDGISMSTSSAYCTFSEFSLNKNETIEIADAMHLGIPDENVYTKDENSTNIYSILKDFGSQIDSSKFESKRVKEIFDITKVKESELQASFGRMFGFAKPDDMSYAEYRAMLQKLFGLYSKAGTIFSMKEMAKLFTGAYPEIIEYKNKYGWIVYSTRRDPTISPFPKPNLPFKYDDPTMHFFPLNDLDANTNLLVPKCMPLSRAEKAFTIDMKIKNPFKLNLNNDLIAATMYKILPAHVKMYLYIENIVGVSEVYSNKRITSDWDYTYSGSFYFSSEGL